MIVHKQDFIPLKVTSIGVLRLNAEHKEDFWQIMPSERFEITQYSWHTLRDGTDVYEGDKVLVSGLKKSGDYVTEVVRNGFGFTLKENKTYISDNRCLIAIKKVVGNIFEPQLPLTVTTSSDERK